MARRKKKRAYTKRNSEFWKKNEDENMDIGLLKPTPPPKKKPVPVKTTEAHDDELIAGLQKRANETYINEIRSLNEGHDQEKIEAPKYYSDRVIGETMLSVLNGLRNQSQHDVILAVPQLIKDIVDQAYAKGREDSEQ